ncbi:MAG: hypothetical protein LBR80_10010 [Deltaproteobacteria bacterium]|jgi:4-diphosphocytidyl-2-C-methyl-D-erythritol kinase|nr:hypothetical protein [Deltaproteobacteria bacterium]
MLSGGQDGGFTKASSGFPVKFRAPAKVNLFLRVLETLPSGMHRLLSLAVPVDLADELAVEDAGPLPGEDSLAVEDAIGAPAVPTDLRLAGPKPLVLRAVAALRAATGFPDVRVRVGIIKRIPYGAGLGGASSDAARTLEALNALAPSPAGREALSDLAQGLGADLPFFLGDLGPKIMGGTGEILTPYRGPELPRALALAGTGSSLSTAAVFGEYELTKSGLKHSLNPSLTPEPPSCPPLGANDLFPAALRLSPELAGLLEEVSALAPGPYGLSGSGPVCWALFPCLEDAGKAADGLSRRGRWAVACSLILG